MTEAVQKRRVPAVILGLMLLAVPLLIFGYWFHGAWKDGEEKISDVLVKFDRLRSIAAYKQVLGTLASTADDKVYDDLFLKEGIAAVVSADLLTQLKQVAATGGVEVVRAGDLQPKTEGTITFIGGSLEMSGTISAIYGLVQQIESAKPLLFIDRLDMRSNGSGGAGDKTETRLLVQMHVFGAVRSSKLSTQGNDG